MLIRLLREAYRYELMRDDHIREDIIADFPPEGRPLTYGLGRWPWERGGRLWQHVTRAVGQVVRG